MRIRFSLLSIVLLLAAGVAPILAQSTDEAAKGQVLAMASNPRATSTPTTQDYLAAFQLAHDAGVDGNAFTERWSVLEPSKGQIQVGPYVTNLNTYEDFYDDTLFLGVQVLNTTAKETPSDLLDVPFDDPQMIERFKALLDALLGRIDHEVTYLSIGNEVDVYLDTHHEWDAYKTFYDQAVEYVHQVAPSVQVGVTVTYSGMINHPDEVARLNEHSDVLIVTYYPLGVGFTADNPDAPLTDFPNMVAGAAGRPVVLQEVGYPSAELLGSSDAEQAQFVRSVFAAWRAVGNAIPFLDFFLLHDLTDDTCSSLEEYYGVTNPNFHAYLCTLGLRQADGTPKQAWQTFADEAQAKQVSHGG